MAKMIKMPISYMQADPRWSSISYSVPGENTNIGRAGCGPTCAAMVIASIADSSVTPETTAAWSLKHGYKALRQGTYYTYFVPQLAAYGVKAEKLNNANIYKAKTSAAKSTHKAITKALQSGDWVIACMGKGNWTSSGHYVLAWKTDGEHVWIHDPASTKAGRIYNTLDFWMEQIKYAWRIHVEEQKEKGDDEVVENKTMAVLGQELSLPTIFKDGTNYVSIRALCEALGLDVSSSGSTPIVSMGAIKLKVKGETMAVSGINAAGTTYGAIRPLAEKLGFSVDWDKNEKKIIIE